MFTGSVVAIATPMDEKGNVYQANLKELIDYHVVSDALTIVSVGTTGKSATLDHDEYADVVMMTLGLADGHIPIIAEAGVNAAAEATSLTQRLSDSGVVGYPVVIPYYNRSPQESLYRHFKVIAGYTNLPQILHNVPSRTGYDLPSETMDRLAKIKDIIGIRETTGNLTHVNQTKELISDDFVLLSGDDASALDFMQLGGYGVTFVTTNAAAHDMAQMCKLATEGHLAEIRVTNQHLVPLHNKLFVGPNLISMGWIRKGLGLVAADTLCLPIAPITDSSRGTIRTALKYAGLL